MKEVWYRAFADYTPINYGGGTDEFFCINVEDENDAEQMKAADEKAIKLAKEGRKVMAVVFNCRSLTDFEIKYFGEQICHDREVLAHWKKKIEAEMR